MSGTANFTFPGSFDIVGTERTAIMKGSFTITNDVVNPILERYGTYLQSDPNDLTITGIFGASGVITEKYGANSVPTSNATIIVKQNNIIIDKTKTDKDGKYTIFVEPGVYDIEINAQSSKRVIKNYEITQQNGIYEVYSLVSAGGIFQRFSSDVTSYITYDAVSGSYGEYNNYLVNGIFLDNRSGLPVEGVEFLLTIGNKVVVYFKTNTDGKYHFLLPNSTYNLEIRIPGQHVKIIENFVFDGKSGFLPLIINALT